MLATHIRLAVAWLGIFLLFFSHLYVDFLWKSHTTAQPMLNSVERSDCFAMAIVLVVMEHWSVLHANKLNSVWAVLLPKISHQILICLCIHLALIYWFLQQWQTPHTIAREHNTNRILHVVKNVGNQCYSLTLQMKYTTSFLTIWRICIDCNRNEFERNMQRIAHGWIDE